MKRTEIAMIILISSLCMMMTFFVARSVLGDSVKREKKVKTIAPIEDKIVPPSKLIFNSKAINPTVEVYVNDTITASDGDTVGPLDTRSASDTQDTADQSDSEEETADLTPNNAAPTPAARSGSNN